MQHHPDKVPEDQREESEVKFKQAKQASEILQDDEKRHLYDTHGMAAFDGSRGGPGGMGGVDLDDILAQMFGGGMGGMGGMPPGFGGDAGPQRPSRGQDDQQKYEVSLEDLYKGKTAKFVSTKNVKCSHCKGSGGKEKAKPQTCDRCKGNGVTIGLRSVGPGLVQQERVVCESCSGSGSVYKEKDRCKKCKGKRVTSEKKQLEIYVPRGAQQGERIVLEGEADQVPDQTPGDLVFTIVEIDHDYFQRAGNDLSAELDITLAEALTGFSRVVLKHLDGRGIQIEHPQGKVLQPGQILKVAGEGMPIKRTDTKGDLFLVVNIQFPENGWTQNDATFASLKELLPKPEPPIEVTDVDEVDFESDADLDDVSISSSGLWCITDIILVRRRFW